MDPTDELKDYMTRHGFDYCDMKTRLDIMLNADVAAMREDGLSWNMIEGVTGINRGTLSRQWSRMQKASNA